jgi:hypothetical protein
MAVVVFSAIVVMFVWAGTNCIDRGIERARLWLRRGMGAER